jgi:hypothetical protein
MISEFFQHRWQLLNWGFLEQLILIELTGFEPLMFSKVFQSRWQISNPNFLKS